eukprot:CAMPEP_0197247252 /NCGR_PEP_ID=MMETSP1429-20130617/27360_1 /TAXON_ID=49237 /ORGANISM="Chaetoceros  sp., Strain UNC1202" /LENGTH=172 /DNA_ID=CAMNT_0042708119 /DNA_START=85 /DNA_END=603 /DNA_ORIENTATION=-
MTEDNPTVVLISSDSERYEVPLKVARMSEVVNSLFPEDSDDPIEPEVPCPKVSGPILKKVVEYCKHYQDEAMQKIETPLQGKTVEEIVKPKWYADFCKVDREVMFQLVAAANFMNIKPLLDLTCLAVSVSIKGKSVEELREIFNLPAPETQQGDGKDDSDAECGTDDDEEME